MQVQVHYQGIDSSEWIDQFINRKMEKVKRYLTPAAVIQVHLKFSNNLYSTMIEINSANHKNYAFNADGENLYESFASATDKASRVLNEEKKKLKDRINSKFFSLKKGYAA